jgi:hypothetical protein
MRGPGQPTDVPGNVAGVPIRITNGGTFTTASFELALRSGACCM